MAKVMTIELGVNIDHVATLRQARGTRYPDPSQAAYLAEEAGADAITIHLREDRRHIQDSDVVRLIEQVMTRINLELAATPQMLAIACEHRPSDVCIVPEKRDELTTEGGLNVAEQIDSITAACAQLSEAGIRVSLFIDPDAVQLEAAVACGAPVVELHTGAFADASDATTAASELKRISTASRLGDSLGLRVNAGHGLHYHNVGAIARIREIAELNIGHAIVSRAVFTGFKPAVSEMKRLMLEART